MIKLYWPDAKECEGNGYGYYSHASNMRRESEKLMELTKDADQALIITSADKYFDRVEDKFNWLFTMFELNDIPRRYAENIQKADHLIVPCRFCKELFSRYTDLPISVVQEGCDTNFYSFKERKFGMPFRFLWVGAPNPRKGTEEMSLICHALQDAPFEIYIKTTLTGKIEKHGNIIFDSRSLNSQELLDLYHSAHAFILPSRGEGWGLTLCEAMSTGLPCIAPRHTGIADFFDSDVGYVIESELRDTYEPNYELETKCYFPDPGHAVELMAKVYKYYDEALAKGKKAAKRIRDKFQWKHAAQRLLEVISNERTECQQIN